MPHESTVDHNEMEDDYNWRDPSLASRTRPEEETHREKRARVDTNFVPHLRADTPTRVTPHHDEDDSDEESSASNQSGEVDGRVAGESGGLVGVN